MRVESYDPANSEFTLTYQPACSATDHSLVYGLLDNVSTYGYSGRVCRIGNTGRYEGFDSGNGSLFFLITGTDDADREGSYGRGPDGERPPMSFDPVCHFVQDIRAPCN